MAAAPAWPHALWPLTALHEASLRAHLYAEQLPRHFLSYLFPPHELKMPLIARLPALGALRTRSCRHIVMATAARRRAAASAAAEPHEEGAPSERDIRQAKAEQLCSQGWEYAVVPQWGRTHTAAEMQRLFGGLEPGEEVLTDGPASVAGRVMACRWFGKLGFVSIQDATGRVQLQVEDKVLGTATAGPAAIDSIKKAKQLLDVGDIVCSQGTTVRKTKKGEVSLVSRGCQLLSKAIRPLPEKFHGLRGLESRYRRRPVPAVCLPLQS